VEFEGSELCAQTYTNTQHKHTQTHTNTHKHTQTQHTTTQTHKHTKTHTEKGMSWSRSEKRTRKQQTKDNYTTRPEQNTRNTRLDVKQNRRNDQPATTQLPKYSTLRPIGWRYRTGIVCAMHVVLVLFGFVCGVVHDCVPARLCVCVLACVRGCVLSGCTRVWYACATVCAIECKPNNRLQIRRRSAAMVSFRLCLLTGLGVCCAANLVQHTPHHTTPHHTTYVHTYTYVDFRTLTRTHTHAEHRPNPRPTLESTHTHTLLRSYPHSNTHTHTNNV